MAPSATPLDPLLWRPSFYDLFLQGRVGHGPSAPLDPLLDFLIVKQEDNETMQSQSHFAETGTRESGNIRFPFTPFMTH